MSNLPEIIADFQDKSEGHKLAVYTVVVRLPLGFSPQDMSVVGLDTRKEYLDDIVDSTVIDLEDWEL